MDNENHNEILSTLVRWILLQTQKIKSHHVEKREQMYMVRRI